MPDAQGQDGLCVLPYVHNLWRHPAVCDLAIVQGGLTTTMEVVAAQLPFRYLPLRHHFEQQFNVAYPLDRHRAGHRIDFAGTKPDVLAPLIAAHIGEPADCAPVRPGGAQPTAARLADLL